MKLKEIYKQLFEAGEAAGTTELRKMSLEEAIAYCKSQGLDIPNMERNLKIAMKLFSYGKTKRADMPVIDDKDVKDFQAKLKLGYIDLADPFSDRTDNANPFPTGLSGKEATQFMSNGLYDKVKPDDKTNVSEKSIAAKELIPIQQQVYLDKCIGSIVKFGIEGTLKFFNSTTLITSSDNRIIDGHHRFLSALIIDPNIRLRCLVIDLPIVELLPLATAYGDAIGNKRNL